MSKGISQMLVRLVIFWILIGVSFAMLFFYWKSQLESEHVIEENEVLVARKVLYAKILMSSDMLAYTDENGVHKGVIDYQTRKDGTNKVKDLTDEKLFKTYSYHPDDINDEGYSHYIKIEVLDNKKEKFETVREFSQSPFTSSKVFIGLGGEAPFTMDFPIAVRYAQDDIRLGKLGVDIIKRGVPRPQIFPTEP